MNRMLLFFVAVFTAGIPAAAQSLEADIADNLTGAPVVGAHVSVGRYCFGCAGLPDPIAALSDAAGHVHIAGLSAGDIRITVNGPGHLPLTLYSTAPADRSPLAVRIGLTPEAVISGKVEDEDGFPAIGVCIAAVRYRVVHGRRTATSFCAPVDDRGQYRIANLPPTFCYLRAVPTGRVSDWDPRYVAQYRSGSLQPQPSDHIEVSAGQQLSGMDFHLRKFAGGTVSGHVILPQEALAGQSLAASLFVDDVLPGPDPVAVLGSNFTFRNVPPGRYLVRVHSSGWYPPKPGDFLGEQHIEVSGDLRGVTVSVHKVLASDLPGMIHFQDGLAPRRLRLALRTGGVSIEATTQADGSFVFPRVPPGDYQFVTLGGSQGRPVSFHRVAMRLGEKDVLNQFLQLDGSTAGPLDLTLAPAINEGNVTINVRDRWGQPAFGAVLLVLPEIPGGSRPTMVNTSGFVNIYSLPPGECRVYAAASESESGAFADPDWVAAHQSEFTVLHILPGNNPPVTLSLRK